MAAEPEFDLEAATDQAIAACEGDMRAAIHALIVANNYLAKELEFACSKCRRDSRAASEFGGVRPERTRWTLDLDQLAI
jgi:hypothetical protein